MALTNDANLAERMRRLRSHSIVRDEAIQAREGPWYYEQTELGFNYRMTDIQAALGTSQMSRLDAFISARRKLADRYNGLLADLPLRVPGHEAESASAWHLYVVCLHEASRRREVFQRLRHAGIGVNVHYIPAHLQPYYRHHGFGHGYCPVAEDYYARAITLPLHPAMSEADQDYVVSALRESLA
jgi:dTDP-4-amino-4,6-dideoxygalactose transaminase